MPNWTRTTYVFAAHQKEAVKDFHDKLSKWTSQASLCPDAWNGKASWLGNILANAGFSLQQVDEILRYRGTLVEINDIEQGKINETDLYTYYYFTALTDTAWVEMSKMWRFILDKLYGSLPDKESIDFAFLAEEQNHDYVHAYNTALLPLMGVAEDKRYYCLTYIGEDFSKDIAFEADQYELTSSSVACLLSEILGRKILEQEIENEVLLQQLLVESNKKLKAVNRHYYVYVVPITVVSEDNFE